MIWSQHGWRRGLAVVLASLAVVVVVAACSSGGAVGGSSTADKAGAPVHGGTLVFDRQADIFTFDPYNTQDDESIFTEMQIYDRLVALSPNGKSVVPELATSWSIAPNGLTADFHLRQGVKFSDGTPLTVNDVVFSLERAINQQGSWGFLFSPVKRVVALNSSTVQLQMSTPFAPLLAALSTFAASIYSESNFKKWGSQEGSHPLGTGPFALQNWSPGSSVVLVRNKYYWQKGKPYLNKIVFNNVANDNSRVLDLESGTADVIDNTPPNQVAAVKSHGDQVESVLGSAVGWVTLNEHVPPLNEANVRLALAYAMDRATVAKTVYFGLAKPALSVIPSGTFYYNGSTDPITFNLAKAKALLAKSTVPHGFTLNVMIASGDTASLDQTEIWSADLAKIGIKLNVTSLEQTTAQQRYNTAQYAAWVSEWTNDTPDPDEMMGAGLVYLPQDALHTYFNDPQIAGLVAKARQQLKTNARAALYTEIQKLYNTQGPYIYTVDIPRLYSTTPSVHGFMPNSQGDYELQNVWIGK
jgi:peptide/nickel transport system substrate-binding protein